MTTFYNTTITRTCVFQVDCNQIFNITKKFSSGIISDMLNPYVKLIDKILKEQVGDDTTIFGHNGPLILSTKDDSKIESAINIVNTALDLFPSFILKYGLLTFQKREMEEIVSSINTSLLAKRLNLDLSDSKYKESKTKI